MRFEAVCDGVYKEGADYYTLNLVPGESVYGEELVEDDGMEYRRWDPYRSKLAAFLKLKGALPIRYDMDILYLGAGDGTTVSHLSDILTYGKIFAVESSKKPYKNLLSLSKKRKNIFPILADARDPENYREIVRDVDMVYQDISQRDQFRILMKNLMFLKDGSYVFFAVKARSIDAAKPTKDIFRDMRESILEEGLKIIEDVDISRWQKDHRMVLFRN
ncbi:MAG: fibrillarin-like rRNA/tRNA 2'-O-methyltransferase [Thermoplasmata archaeon]